MKPTESKISELIKEAVELTGFSENELGIYLGLTGRGMIALYKQGKFDDTRANSSKRKHILKLEQLIKEAKNLAANTNKDSELNRLLSANEKRISQLELDVDLLKRAIKNLIP